MRAHTISARAKGVKRVYKNKIDLAKYEKCIFGQGEERQEEGEEENMEPLGRGEFVPHTVRVSQVMIRSVAHQNMLMRSDKVAFSSFDDKRYYLCAKHNVPYGSTLMKERADDSCMFCEASDTLYI